MGAAVTADRWTCIGIMPLRAGLSFGAEVTDVVLWRLDDAAIHQAWIAHQVLVFRDQSISGADLIAFSRRFGDLDHAPVQENGQSIANGLPEI
jgi:taurine dioxygenase